MNAPHFESTITLGNVLLMISFIGGFGVFVVTQTWKQSAFQTSTELRLSVGEAIREKYLPTIDAIKQTLDVTNERLSSQAAALTEQRNATRELVKETGAVRERLIAIEAVLKPMNQEPFRP